MSLTLENYKTIKANINNFAKIEKIESKLMLGTVSKVSPLVTIIIPTYKREIELEKAIYSVLNQENHNIDYEIIVVDNSSDFTETNDTLKLIKKINSEKILYYINTSNLGQAGNWNRGFELANGKFAALLHDDDLLAKKYFQTIEKDLAIIKNKKIGFIRGSQITFSDEADICNFDISYKNKIKEYRKIHSLFLGIGPSSCPSCGILFDREAVMQTGGFNQDFYPSFDYIVGYQLLSLNYKVYFSDSIYGFYRIGVNESMKRENIINFVKCDFLFREFLYRENLFARIFGICFRKVQYKKSLMNMHNVSKTQFRQNISLDEFDFKGWFHKKMPLRTFIFDLLFALFGFYQQDFSIMGYFKNKMKKYNKRNLR